MKYLTYGYESCYGYVFDMSFDTRAEAEKRLEFLRCDPMAKTNPPYIQESVGSPDPFLRGVEALLAQMKGQGES